MSSALTMTGGAVVTCGLGVAAAVGELFRSKLILGTKRQDTSTAIVSIAMMIVIVFFIVLTSLLLRFFQHFE